MIHRMPALKDDAIVLTTWEITSPPRVAERELPEATRATSRTLPAVCFTVEDISSNDDALCSRLAAVCSVRAERSIEAVAISVLA